MAPLRVLLGLLGAMCLLPSVAAAQNVAGQGQNWSGSWGFSSATDRSVSLNQAQVIRQVEEGVDPTTSYYTTNSYTTDNRSNYSQTQVTGDGATTVEVVGGDKIGQKTYSVGSLNTGSTEIQITGDGNYVDANNSATTNGCVDASISEATFLWQPTDGSAGGTLGTPTSSGPDLSASTIGGGCQ